MRPWMRDRVDIECRRASLESERTKKKNDNNNLIYQ